MYTNQHALALAERSEQLRAALTQLYYDIQQAGILQLQAPLSTATNNASITTRLNIATETLRELSKLLRNPSFFGTRYSGPGLNIPFFPPLAPIYQNSPLSQIMTLGMLPSHDSSGQDPNQCSRCKEVFYTQEILVSHMIRCDKWRCADCAVAWPTNFLRTKCERSHVMMEM